MGSKRKAPGDTSKKYDEDTRKQKEKREPARKQDVRTTPDAVQQKTGIRIPFLPFKPDRTTLLMGGILLVAFIIRMLPLTYCITGGHVLFAEFDPYYHMRRIMYVVAHFPLDNSFDSYVNYPYGFGISWPPLFDLIGASLSLLVGLGHPSQFTIEIVSAAEPVLLGLLSIVLLYYIVKDAINKNVALIAALFMAILPASIFRTIFGFTDHHALEVFVSLAMYLFFMRAVTSAHEEKLSLSNLTKYRKPLIYAVLAGIAIAAMVFSWDGAPIFIGVVVAFAFVQFAYDALRHESSEYLMIIGLISSLVSVLVVAPFALASPEGQNFVVTAMYVSWFHIIYLFAITMFFLVMGGLTKLFEERKAPWFSAALTIAAGVVVMVIAAKFAIPSFYGALESGVRYLLGQGNVEATIVEMEPLFMNNGQLSYDIPWTYLSTGGLLAVIGIPLYLLNLQWKNLKNYEIFLLVWTLIILILGILQKRFIYLLAVNVALFAGFTLYKVLDLAGLYRLVGPTTEKKRSHAREASLTPPIVAVGIVSILLIISILMSPVTLTTSPEFYTVDWNNACQWVNDHTPKTSFVYSADNGTHPEYGIMSWWDYGNFILYKAERPAVANNFQTGVQDAANFFIAQDEASANAVMDKRDAKYVMLDYRLGSPWSGVSIGVFENMPYLAGDDTDSYHMSYSRPVPYGRQNVIGASDKYYDSMYSRLFNRDGLGGKDPMGINSSGLERYRLLYVSQGEDPVKVFEYVKGANITGQALPGADLELRLNVSTPDGDLTYYSSTVADANGSYSFKVPYPTSGATGEVTTGPQYNITSGRSSVGIQVSSDAVDNGETITAGGLQ